MLHSLFLGAHRVTSVTSKEWKEVSVRLGPDETTSNFIDVKGDVILVRLDLTYLTFLCLALPCVFASASSTRRWPFSNC